MLTSLDLTDRRYTLDEVLPYITEDKRNFRMYDGWRVKMNSQRYSLFKDRGCVCVACGRVGAFFLLRRTADPKAAAGRAHFNLWCEDPDGTLVMFTKDHIIPKSKGGRDNLSNYQTMCCICNGAKADK